MKAILGNLRAIATNWLRCVTPIVVGMGKVLHTKDLKSAMQNLPLVVA